MARDDRICNLFNREELGEEYHYIFECNYLKAERKNIPVEFYKKNTMFFLTFRKIIWFYVSLNFVK